MKQAKKKSRFDRLAADTKNPEAVDRDDEWDGFRNSHYTLAAEGLSRFDKRTSFQIPDSMDADLLQAASLKILEKLKREPTTADGGLIVTAKYAARDATFWVNDCTVHLPRDAFKRDENGECVADKWHKQEYSDETLKDYGRNRFSRSEAQEQCDLDETLEWLYVDLCQDEIDRAIVHYLGIDELSLDETADRLDISRREVTNRLDNIRTRRRAWEWN